MSKDNASASTGNLSPETNEPSRSIPKKKSKNVVADSWEDEDLSDSEPEINPLSPATAAPAPPPPTPVSAPDTTWSLSSRPTEETHRRPEKTDAVARRMIAAGLGLKAPKQTDEQRAYQKSVREQERKKREQDKADEQRRKEEAEKAKAAVWDD